MKNWIFISILLLFGCMSIHAQEVLTTKEGKKIVIRNDGTWAFVDSIASANDCSGLIKTQLSSGKSYQITEKDFVISTDGGKTGFRIFAMNSSNSRTTVISITVVDELTVKCIRESDKVNVVFKDGSRIVLANSNSFNCEGKATVNFGESSNNFPFLSDLRSKRIDYINVWAGENSFLHKFSDSQATEFSNAIDCLLKAKSK